MGNIHVDYKILKEFLLYLVLGLDEKKNVKEFALKAQDYLISIKWIFKLFNVCKHAFIYLLLGST